MPKDITEEITQQINSLNGMIPDVNNLANFLAQPIISNDFIERFNAVPPAQKEQWLKNNQPNLDTNSINESDKIISELLPRLSIILGSDQIIQGLMAAQQQQKLQSAQNPKDKSYGIDQQD